MRRGAKHGESPGRRPLELSVSRGSDLEPARPSPHGCDCYPWPDKCPYCGVQPDDHPLPTGEITRMTPTIEEKYTHMRANADAFVESMRVMVAKFEREGNEDMACNLRVWCLNPWEAAVRDDESGDLWPTCEVCGDPIKNDIDRFSGDECDFHRSCVEDAPVPTGM